MTARRATRRNAIRANQWAVLVACGGLLIVTIALAGLNRWPSWHLGPVTEAEATDAAFRQSLIGSVVLSSRGQCRRYRYDNETSATIPEGGYCDQTVRLEDEADQSSSATRRLDALSKSFLGR
jgi:hypothetical protein